MVVRSSLHRTKYSRGRPNAKKPDVQRELPPELRTQQLLTFDQANYDLRGRVCELLRTVPSVGASGDRLEDFAMAPDAWASKDLQCKLTEAVLADDAFLGEYDRFVREVCVVHVKKRLAACGFCDLGAPLTFYYQRPPTLRLQPGPSERHVARHDLARDWVLHFGVEGPERKWGEVRRAWAAAAVARSGSWRERWAHSAPSYESRRRGSRRRRRSSLR